MVRTEKGLKFKLIELSIRPGTLSTVAAAIVLPIFGAFLFFLFWYILSLFIRELPAPISTLKTLFDLISNPFYDLGPNDKGIGWQLLTYLKRVFLGFLIGSLIAQPAFQKPLLPSTLYQGLDESLLGYREGCMEAKLLLCSSERESQKPLKGFYNPPEGKKHPRQYL